MCGWRSQSIYRIKVEGPIVIKGRKSFCVDQHFAFWGWITTTTGPREKRPSDNRCVCVCVCVRSREISVILLKGWKHSSRNPIHPPVSRFSDQLERERGREKLERVTNCWVDDVVHCPLRPVIIVLVPTIFDYKLRAKQSELLWPIVL
jgi:hypothetical protein